MATEVPQHHKAIAKHVAAVWQSRPQVRVWSVEQGSSAKQAIVSLESFPSPGITAYSTVGLSDHGGFEISTASKSTNESFVNALFDVASFIIGGHRTAEPGAKFEKVLSHFYSRSNAGHLLLASVPPPHLGIADLAIGSASVRWLYGWPITSDELIIMEKEGYEAFAQRLKKADGANLYDLDRPTLAGVPIFDPWKKSQ